LLRAVSCEKRPRLVHVGRTEQPRELSPDSSRQIVCCLVALRVVACKSNAWLFASLYSSQISSSQNYVPQIRRAQTQQRTPTGGTAIQQRGMDRLRAELPLGCESAKSQYNNGVWTAYGPNNPLAKANSTTGYGPPTGRYNPLAMKAQESQLNKKSQFNNGVWTAYGPIQPLGCDRDRGLNRPRAEHPLDAIRIRTAYGRTTTTNECHNKRTGSGPPTGRTTPRTQSGRDRHPRPDRTTRRQHSPSTWSRPYWTMLRQIDTDTERDTASIQTFVQNDPYGEGLQPSRRPCSYGQLS